MNHLHGQPSLCIVGGLPLPKSQSACQLHNRVCVCLCIHFTLTRPAIFILCIYSHKLSAISRLYTNIFNVSLTCIAHCKYHVSRVQIIWLVVRMMNIKQDIVSNMRRAHDEQQQQNETKRVRERERKKSTRQKSLLFVCMLRMHASIPHKNYIVLMK